MLLFICHNTITRLPLQPMKKLAKSAVLLLLLTFILPVTKAWPTSFSEIQFLWIFFTDKGNIESARKKSLPYLPKRTLVRRIKSQRQPLDYNDLPVNEDYIRQVEELGAKIRYTSRWINAVTAEVSPETSKAIEKLPFVESTEPIVKYKNTIQKPPDLAPGILSKGEMHPFYGTSARQIQQISADAIQNKGYYGEGIVIAVLDTGFDLAHESLQNIRILAEYDFIYGDSDTKDTPPEDDIGQDNHGTEVLSILAGNSPGMFIGVAPEAEYILAKTERVSYNGTIFEQEIEEDWWIAGLEWAEINGTNVVSSSLGYSDWYSYSDMDGSTAKTTIAANIAIEKGISIVVSAGNEGKSSEWPYISAPADGFNVIAVGAVDDSGRLADFSSIGPTYDGRIKPDVVAMGKNTYTADPNSVDGYRQQDGTSMATPLVAGTVALLLQASPELIGRPENVVKLLKFTAQNSTSPDNRYGWGLINAQKAYEYSASPQLLEEAINWNPASQLFSDENVKIYPNPLNRSISRNQITIYCTENIEGVEIYNLSGLLVYKNENLGNTNTTHWDTKNNRGKEVASGIYICIVQKSSQKIETKKIAIIR
ncbi:S8 family serine peptidase [Candidatus Poribacteria bacterium]|nr:S8 family serine peptidase [Candidatus Poribacteria bacterium]